MSHYQRHLLSNRIRRIPRRIHALHEEINDENNRAQEFHRDPNVSHFYKQIARLELRQIQLNQKP